jgi:hypothetical protein
VAATSASATGRGAQTVVATGREGDRPAWAAVSAAGQVSAVASGDALVSAVVLVGVPAWAAVLAAGQISGVVSTDRPPAQGLRRDLQRGLGHGGLRRDPQRGLGRDLQPDL